jgi:hypothetical protein
MQTKRKSHFYRWVLLLMVWTLLMTSAPLQAAPHYQSDRTLTECSQVDEAALQDELNRVTQQVFAIALAQVDLAALVDAQWQQLEVDLVVDAAIDQAVAQVKNEKDLWDKFLSSWSPEKAEELTRAVANRAFASTAIGGKIEELSTAVADELAQKIGVLSAESASAAFYCLQTFVNDHYATVLLRTFESQVQRAAERVDVAASSELDTGILTVLDQHKTALGGIGVIIAAQIARRMVQSIGQQIAKRVAGRIVGRVLGRVSSELIPIVGWLVGAGLIAYDVYTSRDGALPQIQETLKSAEIKAGIRSEMVAAMEPEFRREAPQIARDVANDLFSQWREVKRNIRQVLELAESNPGFGALLNRLQTPDDLARLVSLVSVARPALGEEGFAQAVADGSLAQVLAQPASSYPVIEATKSISTALAWNALAGALIDPVVSFELYKHQRPENLTRPLLEKLLALDNRAVIEKLALLDVATIETLLTISTNNLIDLTSELTPVEVKLIAGYLPRLTAEQKNQLITQLVSNPTFIQQLQASGVQDYLVNSTDLEATLVFLAEPRGWGALAVDLQALFFGKAPVGLFWYKYGAGQSTLIAAGLLLVLLFAVRLIYGLLAWLVHPVASLFGGKRAG